MRVACIEPAFCSFVQCFCPNEPLHLASVENPPVKTAEMILKKSTCFLSFPDSGATARDHSCTSLPSSHLVSRTFSHRSFGLAPAMAAFYAFSESVFAARFIWL